MCTALLQRKRGQRCDSENEHSAVTAMVRIVMLQRWQWHGNWHCCDSGDNRQCCVTVSGGSWHRCDSDVYISVTAVKTDSAVTAVKTGSAVTAVAADSAVTAMCTLVWQRYQLPLLSQWRAHRCHTNRNIVVTALWQRCQCHRCHSAVSCHHCHTSVHSSVTALSLSPLLHCCQFNDIDDTLMLLPSLSQYCHYH